MKTLRILLVAAFPVAVSWAGLKGMDGPADETRWGGGKAPLDGVEPSAKANRPLPFGFGINYFYQKQDYRVTELEADVPEFQMPELPVIPPAAYLMPGFVMPEIPPIPEIPAIDSGIISRVESEVHEVNAKLDWWALPFLNVHALFGTLTGSAKATVAEPLGNFTVDYDGVVYGGGLTLAGGYKWFFASVTADYTWGDVDLKEPGRLKLDDPSGIETLVIEPRLGINGDRWSLWGGAHYQATEHTQSGSFDLEPLGEIPFRATAEDAVSWSWLAGGEWRISRNWIITAEAGFGQRTQAMAGVTYRF